MKPLIVELCKDGRWGSHAERIVAFARTHRLH